MNADYDALGIVIRSLLTENDALRATIARVQDVADTPIPEAEYLDPEYGLQELPDGAVDVRDLRAALTPPDGDKQ